MKSRIHVVAFVVALALIPTVKLQAQTTNPPYIREFPSMERVTAEIKGADPMDTAARRMGAFWQLQEIIKTLAGLRGTRAQLTPDEGRLMGQYRLGYSNAEQPYAHIPKTPSHPDKEKWWKAHSFYEVDEGFRDELFERFLSPALRDQFFRVKGETKAVIDQRKAARAQALKEEQQQQAQAVSEFDRQYKQPEWKRKLARCVASGRSESQCFSEQIGSEVDGLLPFGPNKRPAGLTMNGVYAAPGGLSVAFGPQGAYVTCKAVSASADYAVRQEGGQLQIRLLENSAGADVWQGQRIALPFRPDGRLSGAGLLKVSGSVIVGHKKETAWEKKEISAFDAARTHQSVKKDAAGNLYVEEQVERDVPITAPKTEQCVLGVLAPTNAATGPMVLASIFGGTDDAPAKMPAPGLRMTGTYKSPTGLEVEFHLDSAVLGCREAVVARDYSVSASSGRVTVNIQNGGAPLALELSPDGALAGAGQVHVSGRVMAGSNRRVDENTRLVTHDPVFQPVTDTCDVGVLTSAQSGSTGRGTVAGNVGAPSSSRQPTTPAKPNNAPTATTPPATTASAVLTVTDAFAVPPGTASPFVAGQIITLWKDSWENVLRKVGVRPPPGTSAVRAWLSACASGQPLCKQVIESVGPYAAANARFGPGRQAQFSAVPPGIYYVFAATRYNNQPFLWDLRVDLKPGANAVTLEQRNSTPVN